MLSVVLTNKFTVPIPPPVIISFIVLNDIFLHYTIVAFALDKYFKFKYTKCDSVNLLGDLGWGNKFLCSWLLTWYQSSFDQRMSSITSYSNISDPLICDTIISDLISSNSLQLSLQPWKQPFMQQSLSKPVFCELVLKKW